MADADTVAVDGDIELYYELHGSGEPLALVHGSWTDAGEWEPVVGGLAESFWVLVYDRRGHSRSSRPEGQGSVDEDGDDLAALLEELELAPAHVATDSWGGNIALRLAIRRPGLFCSLSCHEPPLWGVLDGDPESRELIEQDIRNNEVVGRLIADGEYEAAARRFIEVAVGPGAWEEELPPEVRATLIENAPTFLDEVRDPDQFGIDEQALARLEVPVRLTHGSESPPVFRRLVERLTEVIPRHTRETFAGATHLPHLQTPERYVEQSTRAMRQGAPP